MALKLNELMFYLYRDDLLNQRVRLGQDSPETHIRITLWDVPGVSQPTTEEIALWSVQYEPAYRLQQFQEIGEDLVSDRIDAIAAERKYSSGVSCVSYANSTNLQWKAEAEAFIAWRDSICDYAIGVYNAIEAGGVPPTEEEFIAGFPVMNWPNYEEQ